MKPIKLVMNAFGPYPNEEVIDFSVLKDNNLFLISGPTGAGKTTIFDAMSFALFGVANGEQRNNDSLRSQFSKDEVLTQVTLEFMIKGIKYEINRIPNQIKPKRKGEGFTTQNSDATLKIFNFDDVKVIVGVKNVNDKINEVLGLDCEQFKQIMMIPQGEFRKLLVSDSVDREKILQKLFDTKRYKNIQDKLKSEEKLLKIEREDFIKSELESINRIKYDENNNGIKELLESKDKNVNKIINIVNQSNIEDKKKLKEKKIEIEKGDKDINDLVIIKTKLIELNKKINNKNTIKYEIEKLKGNKEIIKMIKSKLSFSKKAKEIKPLKDNLENMVNKYNEKERVIKNNEIKIKNLEKTFIKTTEEYGNQSSKESERSRESLNKEIIEMKNLADDVIKIDKLINDEKKYKDINDNNIKREKEVVSNLITTKESIIRNKKLIKEIDSSIDLIEITKQISENKKKIEIVNDSIDLKNKINSYIYKSDESKKELNLSKERYELINNDFIKMKLIFHSNQAALLAKELGENQPCPVCGSTNHIRLATFSGEEVSDQELNKLEIKKNKAFENFKNFESNNKQIIKEIELENENLKKLLIKLELKNIDDIIKNDLKELLNSLVEKEKEYSDIKDDFIKNREKSEKLLKEISDYEKEIIAFEDIKTKINEEIQENLNKLTEVSTKLKDVYKRVPLKLRNYSNFSKEVKLRENKYKKLKLIYENVIKKYNDEKFKIKNLESLNKMLSEESIRSKEEIEITKNLFDNKLIEFEFNKDTFQVAADNIKKIKEFEVELDNYNKELNRKTSQYDMLVNEIGENKVEDIEIIENEIESKKILMKKKNEEKNYISNRYDNNYKELKNIKFLNKEVGKIEKKFFIIGDLSNVANGNNEKRISFERYVLAAFLEDIIYAANTRLDKMTDGRYQMLRTDKKERANKQSGLEIEVFDNYTGKTRHVKTLSGGESFKASLAMALGLSDVVQEYAGNVRLDTMFIDEGFGTLDSESLDSAINCLIDLQKNGRLVGIISHVPELKDRIPSRLEVISSNIGSETRFVI